MAVVPQAFEVGVRHMRSPHALRTNSRRKVLNSRSPAHVAAAAAPSLQPAASIAKCFAVTRRSTRASTRNQTAVRRKGEKAALKALQDFDDGLKKTARKPSPSQKVVLLQDEKENGRSQQKLSRATRKPSSRGLRRSTRKRARTPLAACAASPPPVLVAAATNPTKKRRITTAAAPTLTPVAAAAAPVLPQAFSPVPVPVPSHSAESVKAHLVSSAPMTPRAPTTSSVSQGTPTPTLHRREVGGDESEVTMDFLNRVYDALSTSYVPDQLKGREHEHNVIWNFLETCLRKRRSNSMILVGSPGVGKTALMTSMLRKLNTWEKDENLPPSHIVNLNAMRFSPATAIYPHLLNEVAPSKKRVSAFEASQKLEARFLCKKRSSKQKMTVVIIDEIDALLESSQTVLYKLFSWPKQPGSTLIVIGISNEIELTNLFLPRLSQRGCSPDLLVFDPYTQRQLSAILDHRIAMCAQPGDGDNALIERSAMTLITKKVASVSGDIRKGLEICRKAFRKLAEKAAENQEEAADDGSSSSPQQTVRVRFVDVLQVIRTFFSSPFVSVVRTLPKHQQTALCVAVIMDQQARGRDVSVGNFLEFFNHLANRWDITRPAYGEFWDMIQALASHGLVSVGPAKLRLSKKPATTAASSSSSAGGGGGAKKQRSKKAPRAPKQRRPTYHQRTLGGGVGGGGAMSNRNGVLSLVVAADDVRCGIEGNHVLARLLATRVEVEERFFS